MPDSKALTDLSTQELNKVSTYPIDASVIVVNNLGEPLLMPATEVMDKIESQYSDSYLWDDIIQPLMGKKLDTTSGKLDYEWTDKALSFDDSTVISNDTHKIHFGYQINHKFKLDGKCHPHIHWIQKSADSPNWWLRWRIWQNGKVAGAWTEQALSTQIFTYTSGTILQISYFDTMIDFANEVIGGLGVSDFLDVEVTRDTNNASGLFAGNDPVIGKVSVKGFDAHLQVDSNGSNQELQK